MDEDGVVTDDINGLLDRRRLDDLIEILSKALKGQTTNRDTKWVYGFSLDILNGI